MANWSELQYELLAVIARRLNLVEDYLNFRSVCKSWRCAATKDNFNSDLPRVPWLMLADSDEEEDSYSEEYDTYSDEKEDSHSEECDIYCEEVEEDIEDKGSDNSSCRKFFSLSNGMILKRMMPEVRGKRCMHSLGWFITVGKDEGEINLLHPFSGVQIELPHQNTTEDYRWDDPWTFIHKAVLSASPSHTSDYVLMVIEGDIRYLSYWRPGDLTWSRIRRENYLSHPNDQHCDVVYFNSNFYVVDGHGCVFVCHDIGVADQTKLQRVAQLPSPNHHGHLCYILELLGSLFVVVRLSSMEPSSIPITHMPYDDEDFDDEDEFEFNQLLICKTRHFRVYKVDLASGKLMKTKQLGDRAFFLGFNASLSVQASQCHGIKPNHIYFTDDCLETCTEYAEGAGSDMGVFNLANGRIELLYKGVSLSRFTPPTWVTPTLY